MLELLVSAFLATLIATAYIYVKHKFSYWKRRGIAYAAPTIPFGNFTSTFLKKKSFGQQLHDLYGSTDATMLGIYTSIRPAILIRDPRITRGILIKDFQSFWHRGFHFDQNVDSLAGNLFAYSGDGWKYMRAKLSPAFTTGKIKAMFGTINDCGNTLEKYLNKLVIAGKEIEISDVFSRFTTNVIASVGFGIDIDCFENPDDEFKQYGWKFFQPKFKNVVRFNMSYFSPFLTRLFGVRFADKDIEDFMKETICKNLKHREKNNVSRKDFFQLLMQLRNTGKVHDDDDDWATKTTSDAKSLSLDDMTAQAYMFFIAGYETSSTLMSFCMYELAKNPDIQQKAYEEIANILQKHDEKLTYDALSEMTYLLNPPFELISRQYTQDYKVADSDLIIEKGTSVLFSIAGPHYDAKYYDEPEKFNPDRFKDDQKANKNSIGLPYLPFGDGPRNCIGMRLGKIQAKTGVCLMLWKFYFELGAQHINKPLVLNPLSGSRKSISGISLKVVARKNE